jgi:hypothetical protein
MRNSRILPVLIVTCLFFSCNRQEKKNESISRQTTQEKRVLPKSTDYPNNELFSGKIAKVDLDSDPKANKFRTVLREGATAPPDFAGRCKVIVWGCGTNCSEFAIVDLATGYVFVSPERFSVGINYNLHSNLLILESPESYEEACKNGPSIFCDGGPSFYFRWDGKKLVLVDTATVPPMPVPDYKDK